MILYFLFESVHTFGTCNDWYFYFWPLLLLLFFLGHFIVYRVDVALGQAIKLSSCLFIRSCLLFLSCLFWIYKLLLLFFLTIGTCSIIIDILTLLFIYNGFYYKLMTRCINDYKSQYNKQFGTHFQGLSRFTIIVHYKFIYFDFYLTAYRVLIVKRYYYKISIKSII